MHGFQSGDFVTFKEVAGMTHLNGKHWPVEEGSSTRLLLVVVLSVVLLLHVIIIIINYFALRRFLTVLRS